ncbi:hypothetical protein TrVE_jg14488 [Triparma verrucosa]|uniref:Uncharacterized protein n=1 Tax=Triparma verrucosa TaxID=1606542 RepID=A0A9W7DS20_9STRA|nr:hypothetical protein TrVE_jg14488 [Triparma verrucosa]
MDDNGASEFSEIDIEFLISATEESPTVPTVKDYLKWIKEDPSRFPAEDIKKIYELCPNNKKGFQANVDKMMEYLQNVYCSDGKEEFKVLAPTTTTAEDPSSTQNKRLKVPEEGNKRKNLKQKMDRILNKETSTNSGNKPGFYDIKVILEASDQVDDGGGGKPKKKPKSSNTPPADNDQGTGQPVNFPAILAERDLEITQLQQEIISKTKAKSDKAARASPSVVSPSKVTPAETPIAESEPEQDISQLFQKYVQLEERSRFSNALSRERNGFFQELDDLLKSGKDARKIFEAIMKENKFGASTLIHDVLPRFDHIEGCARDIFEAIDLDEFDAIELIQVVLPKFAYIEDDGLDFATKILETYEEDRELMDQNDEKTAEKDKIILTMELLSACKKGQCKLVDLLVKYGANVKEGLKPEYHMLVEGPSMPLLAAVEHNRREMVEFLLDNDKMKVDVNGKGHLRGGTSNVICALHLAMEKEHHDMATFLIEKGSNLRAVAHDIWWNPLSKACKANHSNLVKVLIKVVDDKPERLKELCYPYKDGSGPPQTSSGTNGFEEQVADIILMKNQDGTTALDIARQHCDDATIGLLLRRSPESPLFKLLKFAYKGEVGQLKELFANTPGLNVNDDRWTEHKTRNTALFIAASQGQSQCVKYLLDEQQADVNILNYDNSSSLIAAVQNGSREVTEILLEQNIEINACNKNGFSALYIACSRKRPDLAELLLAKQADPNRKQGKFWAGNPLFIAIDRGLPLDLVQKFVEAGAETKGLLDVAKRMKSINAQGKEILRYLKKMGAD